jgi:hypothetical protein
VKIPFMNTSHILPLVMTALGLVAVPCRAAVLINFDSASQFATDFPTTVAVGGQSTASVQPVSPPDHLLLHGEDNTGAGPGAISIYTASSYSTDMDFITEAKTFVFSGAALAFSSGGGLSMSAALGVMSDAQGQIVGTGSGDPNDGVYFRINHISGGNSVQLFSRLNSSGADTKLGEWAIPDNVYSFTNLSLTFSETNWSVSGVSTSGNTVISGSGAFATTWSSSNWGSDFYVGLSATQSANAATRWAELSLDSISVSPVPEPGTVGMLLGGVGLLVLIRSRCRRN